MLQKENEALDEYILIISTIVTYTAEAYLQNASTIVARSL